MCGVSGVWNYATRQPVDRELLGRMTDVLRHRGPDDGGFHFDDGAGIGLGHRRLSIVDLSAAGRQPMCNEDGTVWTVFNGALYDFPEQRSALESRGHGFRSRTDTEVLVHAYEEHGPACVEHLNGMFGVAIWDARLGRLMLARDRVGEKPLYYHDDGKRLLFASELKSLLVDPAVPRALSRPALGQFLSLGYVARESCIVDGVRKLPAGHRLIRTAESVALERYWDWLPSFRGAGADRPTSDWVAELRATLRASVRSRMISDVPLGAFLSGGLDSSSVVAAMAESSPRPVRTFSIGFAGTLDATRRLAAELGVEESVRFVNDCDRPEPFIAASTVCVLSTHAEGLSNAILEYMALSRPVVASACAGNEALARNGENGFLVPRGSPESLAARLAEILRDRDLARAMGVRGRRHVERRHALGRMVADYEALYDQLGAAR